MSGITLGLDLGPNSIGWALIDDKAQRIIDLGVRVFPEGVDNFDTKKEKPRNEDRRNARMMRRQTRRRAQRKHRLREALIGLGLFPAQAELQRELYAIDPYELRARALDEPLTLHELGRVLLHLNQRRGFKSNKKEQAKADAKAKKNKTTEKTSKPDDQKKTEDLLLEMAELDRAIKESSARTLGEYLHWKAKPFHNPYTKQAEEYEEHKRIVREKHAGRIPDDHVRGRHTLRRMLTDEFAQVWAEQAKHHPDVLTHELAYGKLGRQKDIHRPIPKWDPRRDGADDLESFGLFGLIFFHRTLKPVPREVIGNCELEPKLKRCPRGDRQAQRFRILQEVNNLRLIDGTQTPPTERALNAQERALLIDKLMGCKEADFDKIRKWIGALPQSPAPEQIRFNLEQGKRKKLQGMITDALLAAEGKNNKAFGKDWHKLSEDTKDAIVRALLESLDDEETHEHLVNEYEITSDQADGALSIDFSTGPTRGYVNLSRTAINKLLPYLEQGMRLMGNDETDSAIHAAGYTRRDELQRRIFDKLPDPSRVPDAPIGDIPNPVVKRAIVELRKVVNAIIREYGRPDAVHVEMARELRQGPKRRTAYNSRTREIEAERDRAKQDLNDWGMPYGSRGVNILRVLLWKQQNHDCVYCGNKISQSQLFNDGEVDIDHVLPYSRSLDDSQMNKVICHRRCNHDKGNQTPYEWLAAADLKQYEKVCQHVYSLVRRHGFPYRKYKRFIQKELKLDEFVARQLNATSYITKATVEYLKCLFENEHDVLGLKGQLTAELRRQWGLNGILRDDGLDRKTRDDHRHHAIDAVVVAMTNRSRLQRLARGTEEVERTDKDTGGLTHRSAYLGQRINPPWERFRDDVIRMIESLDGQDHGDGQCRGVSRRVERKVRGALHEDSFYGPTKDPEVFVKRKPLSDLSPNEINKIRDDGIRKIVIDRLGEAGIEFGRGKKPDRKKMKQVLSDLTMPSGVPIKKVRLLVNDKTIQPIRKGEHTAYVKPGSTHHLCIFSWEENGKINYDAVFVTQLEASNRVKREQPIIQRTPPLDDSSIPTDAKFVMSLSPGELLLLGVNGIDRLYVYNTAA